MPAAPPSARIQRTASLSRQVTLELRRAIVSGDVPQGDALREVALAEQLGVSRVPVREALIELERHGLVEFDDKGRTRVPVLNESDLEEIYQLRLALEPLAARLMAARPDEVLFARMKENIAATAKVQALPDLSRLDAEFHDLIAQGSGNRRLQQSWEALRYQVELWLNHMQKRHLVVKRSTREDTVAAHRHLLDVLRRGDAEAADHAMREHIVSWRRMLPERA